MEKILNIGDTFTYEGEEYIVCQEQGPGSCRGCAFSSRNCPPHEIRGYCSSLGVGKGRIYKKILHSQNPCGVLACNDSTCRIPKPQLLLLNYL